MHFEILVEGQTELTALSILLPKILGEYRNPHTWKIHKHRGIGKFPEDPSSPPNPRDGTLLHQLPAKLRAYSKIHNSDWTILVLIDADDRVIADFFEELKHLLTFCDNDFQAEFKFSVEELEAWYLGDRNALIAFNPNIRIDVLNSYEQDSICGTWELLARAEGSKILTTQKRSRYVLDKKKEWSKKIPPHMNIEINASPSFMNFVSTLKSKCN